MGKGPRGEAGAGLSLVGTLRYPVSLADPGSSSAKVSSAA